MLTAIKAEVSQITLTVQVRSQEDIAAVEQHDELANVQYQHADFDEALASTSTDDAFAASPAQPFARDYPKVGRNESCPCGSGKKYKQCHGRLA